MGGKDRNLTGKAPVTMSGPSISAIMLCSASIPCRNYSFLDSSFCWYNNHHVKGFFDSLVMCNTRMVGDHVKF